MGLASTEVDVDDKILNKFIDSILFSKGRYVVSLLWKEDRVKYTLFCNYRQAHKRLLSVNRHLSMTPGISISPDNLMRVLQLLLEHSSWEHRSSL